MDPRIRIHTKMSWIRNTAPKACYLVQKMVEVATTDSLLQLAAIARQHFLQLSVNPSGCFVVQALLNQPNNTVKQVLTLASMGSTRYCHPNYYLAKGEKLFEFFVAEKYGT
jgi:hypothetical protein